MTSALGGSVTDFSGAVVEADTEFEAGEVLEPREADEDLERETDEDVTPLSLEGVLDNMNLERRSLPSSKTRSACVFHRPLPTRKPTAKDPHPPLFETLQDDSIEVIPAERIKFKTPFSFPLTKTLFEVSDRVIQGAAPHQTRTVDMTSSPF